MWAEGRYGKDVENISNAKCIDDLSQEVSK